VGRGEGVSKDCKVKDISFTLISQANLSPIKKEINIILSLFISSFKNQNSSTAAAVIKSRKKTNLLYCHSLILTFYTKPREIEKIREKSHEIDQSRKEKTVTMMMMHKTSYSYPTLKPAEITQCLQDLQIPFNEEDLSKPSPHRMLNVYEAFTEIFMGVTRDQFNQPAFNILEMLEYPELYMDSIALLSFYKQM